MNQEKKSSSVLVLFCFSEKTFPDQLVFLRQRPFSSLNSFAPSRNAIPKKSIAELQNLCRSCQMFTSEKPLECKTYCAEILKSKTFMHYPAEYTFLFQHNSYFKYVFFFFLGSGPAYKTSTLEDALCAFCQKYQIYRISDICTKKLCSYV